MGEITNDTTSLPSITQYSTKDQLETFAHGLINDIACKGIYLIDF